MKRTFEYSVESDPIEGFAVDVWARRSNVGTSKAGILILTDDDVEKRIDSHKNGSLVVLERDDAAGSGWISRSLTDFSPGQRKSDVLARVGLHDWTPVNAFLEKLEAARRRGDDVLAFPAPRIEAIIEFETRISKKRRVTLEDSEQRGCVTGRVESGPGAVGGRTAEEWKKLADFVSNLPLPSAPRSIL